MPSGNDFDYNAALTELIELRYEARETGQRTTPEIQKLERAIYGDLKAKDEKSVVSVARDTAQAA